MSVALHCTQEKNNFEDIQNKYIFRSSNMFLPEEGFHIFMTVLCLYFLLPFTTLSVFDVLPNLALGHSVFWERDERKWFSHLTRLRIQIPGDLLIRWLILHIFLGTGAAVQLLGLSAEHGVQVIVSPAVTLCDSKHKPASPLKMCTSHHLIQMSEQIRNCRDDSMMRGLDRPVRAVIILLWEEIWISPRVCVF